MKSKLMIALTGLALLIPCIAGINPAWSQGTTVLTFAGGPAGGTFNSFVSGIATHLTSAMPDVRIASQGSEGSGENLRRLHAGQVDFGLVYSADAHLGRTGQLPNDERQYANVRTMGYLYGAPAQLVVRADAGFKTAKDLAGKRVAVGSAGSGAALAAERFFRHLGLWDDISPYFLGYSLAASAFRDRKIDAFWVLVGYPTPSIIEAANLDDIALVNLHREAEESRFYDAFPFYVRAEIPAGTYRGQVETVVTFQDAAFWMTNANVNADIVYEALKGIYSPEGLRHMVAAHAAAVEMSLEGGLTGVSVPLHGGAYRFWTEQGLSVPAHLQP